MRRFCRWWDRSSPRHFPKEATAMMSGLHRRRAQAIMLPIALLVGRTADQLGKEAFCS